MSNNENNSLNFSSFDDENMQDIMNEETPQIPKREESKNIKNKKSVLITVCITLIAALLLAFSLMIINNVSSREDEEEDKKDKTSSSQSTKATYTTNSFEYKTTLSKDVKNALNTTSKDYLLLVNKSYPLGESYVPQNLVKINLDICTKESELEKNAALAAEALIAEMIAEGFTDIKITSAYRSYAKQDQLFSGYINTEMTNNPSLTKEQARKIVLGYSAEAGYSEHQSGLCIDLINTQKMVGLYNTGAETPSNPYDFGFAELEEYQWLLENAHKFGFILRYPENKTSTTKYNYESWHYRFVGVDVATKIYKKGITLEEYLK